MDGSYILASTSALEPESENSKKSRSDEIQRAIEERDINALVKLGVDGFESNQRKSVWPILIQGKGKQVERNVEFDSLAEHKDESQVKLDVNRSFINFPPNLSTHEKDQLRAQLELVIITVLRKHPSLNYFQGYHDIISILLLTFESIPETIRLSAYLSLHQIRDNMGKGLEPVIGHLKLVRRILALADPELAALVDNAANLPYFSLSWVLTLLSHDLEEEATIARLFDFLLGRNPAMICYFTVAIILTKKDEILNLDEDDIDDPAILHHTLSKLPSISIPALSPAVTPSSSPDEDLLSPTDDENDGESFTSESMLSGSGDEENETFDGRMLEDPDIFGPAFSFIESSQSSIRSSTVEKEIEEVKVLEMEKLITKTLNLWELFPLLGDSGIDADQIMAPKSTIFTFSLSQEGLLSDAEAEEISKNGTEIVLEEPIEEIEVIDLEKEKRSRRRDREKNLRNVVAVTVVVVGISSILLAIYAEKLKFQLNWRTLFT